MLKKLWIVCVWVVGSLLLTAFTFGGPLEVQQPDLTDPDSILVQGKYIYITQFPEVFVYSRETGKHLNTFGRKGEGPGEFMRYCRLSVQDGRLVVGDRNRVLFFSLEGKFLSEKKSKAMANWGMVPLGDNFVVKSLAKEGKTDFENVLLYDSDLKRVKELSRYQFFYTQWKSDKKWAATRVLGIRFQVYDKNLYVVDDDDSGFKVFDSRGTALRTIRLDLKKIKLTAHHRQMYNDYFKYTLPWKRVYEGTFKNKLEFPSYCPGILRFKVADGRIYVLTYERRGDETACVILDLEGRLIKKVFIPLNTGDEWFQYSLKKSMRRRNYTPTFTIDGGKLYSLVSNEEEESWELQVAEIKL